MNISVHRSGTLREDVMYITEVSQQPRSTADTSQYLIPSNDVGNTPDHIIIYTLVVIIVTCLMIMCAMLVRLYMTRAIETPALYQNQVYNVYSGEGRWC